VCFVLAQKTKKTNTNVYLFNEASGKREIKRQAHNQSITVLMPFLVDIDRQTIEKISRDLSMLASAVRNPKFEEKKKRKKK
jgi:hypothetical protein